jgi:hypothetical protein
MITLFDLFGLVGVVVGLACYARVQWHRDFAKHILYSVGNAVGSIFMMVSLWHNWNLASFISNSCWVVLSCYGIFRCLKYVRKQGTGTVASSSIQSAASDIPSAIPPLV